MSRRNELLWLMSITSSDVQTRIVGRCVLRRSSAGLSNSHDPRVFERRRRRPDEPLSRNDVRQGAIAVVGAGT